MLLRALCQGRRTVQNFGGADLLGSRNIGGAAGGAVLVGSQNIGGAAAPSAPPVPPALLLTLSLWIHKNVKSDV